MMLFFVFLAIIITEIRWFIIDKFCLFIHFEMMRGESERASVKAREKSKAKEQRKGLEKKPFSINQRYSATIPTIIWWFKLTNTNTDTTRKCQYIVKKTPAELTRFVAIKTVVNFVLKENNRNENKRVFFCSVYLQPLTQTHTDTRNDIFFKLKSATGTSYYILKWYLFFPPYILVFTNSETQ